MKAVFFQAPIGCRIDLRFDPNFNVFCTAVGGKQICDDWVEIKHSSDLGSRHPRYVLVFF